MKINLILLQIILGVLWYAVPAMTTVPAWLIFLPLIVFLAILLFVIVGVVLAVIAQ